MTAPSNTGSDTTGGPDDKHDRRVSCARLADCIAAAR